MKYGSYCSSIQQIVLNNKSEIYPLGNRLFSNLFSLFRREFIILHHPTQRDRNLKPILFSKTT